MTTAGGSARGSSDPQKSEEIARTGRTEAVGRADDRVEISRVGDARVVTEAMPGLRSVAVGFWVGSGAVDEDARRFGASHFLEHLLFKGTDDRGAAEIAHAVESVGGDMNAFTTQEYTAFYVRVPDEHLGLALDILGDVVWHPAFRPDEVESERRVILEEIGMRDDAPDDVVHELANEALFPGHPLGRSVLGTRDTIAAMSRDAIAEYHAEHYRPSNVVIAAAGNLDHAVVAERVHAGLPGRSGVRPDRGDHAHGVPRSVTGERRDTEQAHVVLSMRSIARDDPDRYALSVLNQILGGGMSSRLFQEVRERRGSRLLRVLVPSRLRDDRFVLDLRGHGTRARRRDAAGGAARDRPGRDRGDPRARAARGEGSSEGLDEPGARDQRESDAPPRPGPAHPR